MSLFPESWANFLGAECEPILQRPLQAVAALEQSGVVVYPPANCRFKALEVVSPDAVRVVIMGQDPYPTPGAAMGLSFSVAKGVRVPRSLVNIFKELKSDLGIEAPAQCGDLTPWAKQGVLLLNTYLTVTKGAPKSHQKFGWDVLTHRVIQQLSAEKKGIVFILWGKDAEPMAPLIDATMHAVLVSSHPSPMGGACNRGFFGSKPFSKANGALVEFGKIPVDWAL